MIEVKNLTKRYGQVRAVNDISFTVGDVGVYGFLGPNGAGKSTTMNIITGCLAASSGDVIVGGHDIFDEPTEAKKLIGYLPENPPLYADMTPAEYLQFVAKAKGVHASKLSKTVNDVMRKTGLVQMGGRLIRNLSKGYKQRVGIAQALIGDPKIIILDEPTVGLDPLQIIEIRDLIRELGKNHAVILSSHVLPEISAVCDYVIMISHGKIVAKDTLENLNRSFAGTEVLRIVTKGNGDKLRAALSKLEGANNVNVVNTSVHVEAELEVSAGMDIRENISDILRELDMPVLSFTSSAQSLEDIFIKLVNEQYLVEEDPAIPQKKQKKVREKSEDTPKGRAYYGTDEGASDKNEGYSPLFGENDSEKTDDYSDNSDAITETDTNPESETEDGKGDAE